MTTKQIKPTPYAVFGVAPTAPLDEIKRAWRRLARDNHPDRCPDDPDADARFKQASAAWDLLSDPARRAAYDAQIRASTCMLCGRQPVTAGFDICFLCALGVAATAAGHGAKPSPKPQPVDPEKYDWVRDPDQFAERMRRSPADYMPTGAAPSSDDLLGALLSEGAIRAAQGNARVDVRVHVSGDVTHNDFVRQVTRNLRLANRIVKPLYRWWSGAG